MQYEANIKDVSLHNEKAHQKRLDNTDEIEWQSITVSLQLSGIIV